MTKKTVIGGGHISGDARRNLSSVYLPRCYVDKEEQQKIQLVLLFSSLQ